MQTLNTTLPPIAAGVPVSAPACAFAGTGDVPFDCASATWQAAAAPKAEDADPAIWQRPTYLAGGLAVLLLLLGAGLWWWRRRVRRRVERDRDGGSAGGSASGSAGRVGDGSGVEHQEAGRGWSTGRWRGTGRSETGGGRRGWRRGTAWRR